MITHTLTGVRVVVFIPTFFPLLRRTRVACRPYLDIGRIAPAVAAATKILVVPPLAPTTFAVGAIPYSTNMVTD